MQNFFRLFFLLNFLLVLGRAEVGRVGPVRVDVDTSTIPVRVSASPDELNRLALQAFNSHGLYRVVASGFAYDIHFTQLGATQVRAEITQGAGHTPFASETLTGATARQALLRAADFAVVRTNGLGLKGFFTARLAFVSERTGKTEVCISDLFLGEARQLTHDNAFVLTPRWSPDGTRLLYTSYFKSGLADIFQYDLNTYQRTTFVSLRGTNMGARFSPDGRHVAMILSGEGNSEIYVSDAQGHQIARKTNSDAVKSSPCWSPDGTRIAFQMQDGPQLYVIPLSGGAPRRLVTGFSYAGEPDWSRANPNKIACSVMVNRRFQIAVYDFALGRATQVSNAAFDGLGPCWLADGRHLVYTARDRTTSVLCILDTETGKSTPISTGFGGPAMEANVWTPGS